MQLLTSNPIQSPSNSTIISMIEHLDPNHFINMVISGEFSMDLDLPSVIFHIAKTTTQKESNDSPEAIHRNATWVYGMAQKYHIMI